MVNEHTSKGHHSQLIIFVSHAKGDHSLKEESCLRGTGFPSQMLLLLKGANSSLYSPICNGRQLLSDHSGLPWRCIHSPYSQLKQCVLGARTAIEP